MTSDTPWNSSEINTSVVHEVSTIVEQEWKSRPKTEERTEEGGGIKVSCYKCIFFVESGHLDGKEQLTWRDYTRINTSLITC